MHGEGGRGRERENGGFLVCHELYPMCVCVHRNTAHLSEEQLSELPIDVNHLLQVSQRA